MTEEDKSGVGTKDADKTGTLPDGATQKDQPGGKDRSDWIPRARFDELVDQVRDLKGKLDDKAKSEKIAPKELSRTELATAVEKGELTQDQANGLWERQLVERTQNTARETAAQVVTEAETNRRIDAEMRRYKELIPAVMRDGTEERDKVADEYRYLVSTGHPENRNTELAALRLAHGSIERLEKARSRSKPDVQSDEQTGAGGDIGGGDTGKIKGLSPREREYYTSQIAKGRYRDWDAVKEELAHANIALRRKMGAKV